MKIKSINIASFGGVKDLKLELEGGLNVIYGDNEKGKTTVMSFIKMMFYGSERSASQISKNIRKKYTPWDGSQMAGSIDFEFSGRNYRIEREFRSSNSTDRVTLVDLDLGTRQTASGDIGTEFFGLSSAAFERSVFIGQFGFPDADAKAEGEINSKLSNIALTGDETVSFETVKNRILKARTALMSKSGNAGVYDKNMKNIAALEERLQKAVDIQNAYQQNLEKVVLAEAEILKMQKKAGILKAKISAEQDIRNAQKLKNLLALKAQLDEMNKSITLSDGSFADEAYYKKLQFCLNMAEPLRATVKEKENEIETIKKGILAFEGTSPEEREKQASELKIKVKSLEKSKNEISENIDNKKREESEILFSLADKSRFKKKCNLPLVCLSGAFILIAVIMAIALNNLIFASRSAIIGIIMLILGFVIRPEDTAAIDNLRGTASTIRDELLALNSKENEISEELATSRIKLETVNNAMNSSLAAVENQKKLLESCETELQTSKAAFDTEWNKCLLLLSKYRENITPDTVKEVMEEIATGAAKQKELKQQINYILKDVGNISYEEARLKLESMENAADETVDFDALKNEYDRQASAITDGKTKLAAMMANMQSAVANGENPEILRQNIKALKEETDNQRDFCSCAQIALDKLEESFIEVRRSYGSQLEKNAAEILSELTGGKYESLSISKSLDIAAEEKGKFGSREIGYLSSGTADQAYLSLRLSLSRLMSDKEILPIFLDDSLAQYDDTRLAKTLEFLGEYLEDSQGLLFTCHRYVCDTARQSKATIINL